MEAASRLKYVLHQGLLMLNYLKIKEQIGTLLHLYYEYFKAKMGLLFFCNQNLQKKVPNYPPLFTKKGSFLSPGFEKPQ